MEYIQFNILIFGTDVMLLSKLQKQKERLDFSCAIFSPDGNLVANAPHIPVHLGAMSEAVRYQIAHVNNLQPGDVLGE